MPGKCLTLMIPSLVKHDLDGNKLDENNLDDGEVVKLDLDGAKEILVLSQRVARLKTLDLTILS